MRILVTGGAGFIASHVTDAFVAAGHQVSVLDDLSSGKRENLNPKAAFYHLDVQDPGVAEVMRRERPEVLCHHAAQMDVRRSVADPVLDAKINLVGLLNIMEHGRANGLKRVLFASTGGAIYGEQDVYPAPETHKTEPISPYGVAKLASERYLFFYSVAYGISYAALRYANVYGPRQNPHGEAGVVAIFAEKLLRGEQPMINGDGKQTRDYVYVGDLVRANLAALTSDFTGAINLGTGIETDVNTIFQQLRGLVGSAAPEQHGPAKPGEQLRSVIDNRLAQRVLGWRPEVSLQDGLRETLAFFRARVAAKA
ncbi:MAG TPA: NAD-dependent epimerase/dehydratase family protein [Candidatus Margulisiibacteriota bacterium]|nr:NAD-dependent epimerase/dehydratase family protein [Candidatus Margulisiibacteriota bacterium]